MDAGWPTTYDCDSRQPKLVTDTVFNKSTRSCPEVCPVRNGSHAFGRFRVGRKPHCGNSRHASEANEVMANATTLQKDSLVGTFGLL
jgi:hypothetical protein